jgi:hypothetical protein
VNERVWCILLPVLYIMLERRTLQPKYIMMAHVTETTSIHFYLCERFKVEHTRSSGEKFPENIQLIIGGRHSCADYTF